MNFKKDVIHRPLVFFLVFFILILFSGCDVSDQKAWHTQDEKIHPSQLSASATQSMSMNEEDEDFTEIRKDVNIQTGDTEWTKEECGIDTQLAETLNVGIGNQIRIYRIENGIEKDYALYTITVTTDYNDDDNIIRMNRAARKRVNESGTTFSGIVSNLVTHPSYTREEAKTNSDYAEVVKDYTNNDMGVIAIAPHGGFIEIYTDVQADHFLETFNELTDSDDSYTQATLWTASGYKKVGDVYTGAYNRFHITSTAISNSFLKLGQLLDKYGENAFQYAVAFHGCSTAGNVIYIGGEVCEEVKDTIRSMFENELPDCTIQVVTEGEFAGIDPRNIVNRLALNGIQIEASRSVRDNYRNDVAEVLARYIERQLNNTDD